MRVIKKYIDDCQGFIRRLYDPKWARVHSDRPCEKCLEDGGVTRKCCKTVLCDHCYTHRQECPQCLAPTKMEEMTGAAFMITEHSEHEECRKCLDPGLKRRCCGNYYCDNCYYAEAACRSCGQTVGNMVGEGGKGGKGFKTTIILGWAVTFFFCLTIAATVSIIMASEAATPVGIFGHECLGFFRTCDVPLCIEVDPAVAAGNAPLPPLTEWKYCKQDTTEVSIRGYGCVFDHQLYRLTGRSSGHPFNYDLKGDTYAEEAKKELKKIENEGVPIPASRALGFEMCADDFNGGAYVFEEDFENWFLESQPMVNNVPQGVDMDYLVGKDFSPPRLDPDNFKEGNTKRSALWQDITETGWTTNFCGLPDVPGEVNRRALTFKGGGVGSKRYAETKPVDVSSGGWIEADMYFAPKENADKVDRFFCQPAESGSVKVEFKNNNTDDGWELLRGGQFDPWKMRDKDFFKIKLKIDGTLAEATDTSFRFRQIDEFDLSRDAWALDNVRIFRKFPKTWDTSKGFMKNKVKSENSIMDAACCYDTERCEKRMTQAEKDERCGKSGKGKDDVPIPGFDGTTYGLRTVEVLLIGVTILSLIKFSYVAIQDWFVRKRFPFNDEWDFMTKLDWLMQHIPVEWRPSKPLTTVVGDIHASARMMAAQAQELLDEEEHIDEEAILRAEAEAREKKRRKKEKRKRKMKLGYSKELASIDSSDEEDGDEMKMQSGAEGEGELTSDLDKLKRTNMAQLRLPFNTRINENYRHMMIAILVTVFAGMTFATWGLVPEYAIEQEMKAFDMDQLTFTFTLLSSTINFLAFVADFKEIFYVLKNIVPVRDDYVPQITLDLSQEGSALYIGRWTVRLKDVTEVNTFPFTFAYMLTLGLIVGAFPWATLMIIMRELYLPIATTRILIPILAGVILIRVLLGPTFVIKAGFALFYLFNCNPKTRENIGVSFQSRRTKFSLLVGALVATTGGLILVGTFAAHILGPVLAALFGLGLFYGAVAGCTHGLPIRPWLLMTTAQEGTWMRVKKKERCPCIYWANWCTDVHETDEVLVMFPEDSVRFFQALKGGVNGANA